MFYQTPPSYKSRILKIFDFFFISSLPIVYLLLYLDINKLEMEKIIRTKDQVEKLLLKELEIKKEYNYYQNHLSKYSKQ